MSDDDLVTAEEGAAEVKVSPATVRQWAARGFLTATGKKRGRAKLYHLAEIFRAERERRSASRRIAC